MDAFSYLSVLLSIILGLGLIVLEQTATLYVMAAVALPEEVDEAGLDLGVYFDKHHRWFFAFFLATLIVSVAKDLVLGGQLPSQTNLMFHAVLAPGCSVSCGDLSGCLITDTGARVARAICA